MFPRREPGSVLVLEEHWRGRLWSAIPHRYVGGDATTAITHVAHGTTGVFASSVGLPDAHGLTTGEGKIRALAVPTLSRATFLPEVPTIAESGLPGFNAENYFMLLAPRGTAPNIIARWNAAVSEAVADPQIAAQFRRQGLEGHASTPQFVADYLKSEAERWRPVIAATGLKAD